MLDIFSGELLHDTQTAYFNPPYHNFQHWIEVRDAVFKLTNNDKKSPIAFAAILHDACHTWEARAPWDEKIAIKMAKIIWRKHSLSQRFIEKSEIAILWTIFEERANIILDEQKIIADADLSALGWEYSHYVWSAIKLLLETYKDGVSNNEILNFFQYQSNFFNSLTEISWKSESWYLTEEARVMFPHFSRNKDRMSRQVEEDPNSLIELVRRCEQASIITSYRENNY